MSVPWGAMNERRMGGKDYQSEPTSLASCAIAPNCANGSTYSSAADAAMVFRRVSEAALVEAAN